MLFQKCLTTIDDKNGSDCRGSPFEMILREKKNISPKIKTLRPAAEDFQFEILRVYEGIIRLILANAKL